MFVPLAFLYLFVGFIVSTAILRDESMRDDVGMVCLALATGIAWLPLAVAGIVLVILDAARAIRRL
jgi:hypothetical protein